VPIHPALAGTETVMGSGTGVGDGTGVSVAVGAGVDVGAIGEGMEVEVGGTGVEAGAHPLIKVMSRISEWIGKADLFM
jgi:hypothetical protein